MKKPLYYMQIIACFSLIPSMGSAQTKQDNCLSLNIGGYVGTRIDDCIEKRVKAQDVAHLVEPFRHKNETRRWQSEFWGKWVQGAIASYRYKKDPALYQQIKSSVDEMIQTQMPDGYIGNYAPEAQLPQLDIWGRKYTTPGLLAFYELPGEKNALTSAFPFIDPLSPHLGCGYISDPQTGSFLRIARLSGF